MECKKEMEQLTTLCINRISFVLIVCLLITMMSACEMPNVDVASSQEKERMEVDLIELSDEHKKTTILNYDEFYQKYENKILVISGKVSSNHLNKPGEKYINLSQLPYSEEYVKQHNYNVPSGSIYLSFREEDLTDQVKNLIEGDQITVEGTLSPEWDTTAVLENCKLTSFSAYVNPKEITFDINTLFANTKPDITDPAKYPFVNQTDFSFDKSGPYTQHIRFCSELKAGTNPQTALDYAYQVLESLNKHAQELDNSLASSSETSYGGLYDKVDIGIYIWPEGKKSYTDEYYIFQTVGNYIDSRAQIKLQRKYR